MSLTDVLLSTSVALFTQCVCSLRTVSAPSLTVQECVAHAYMYKLTLITTESVLQQI